jgi:sulfite exporter TauE/SafE
MTMFPQLLLLGAGWAAGLAGSVHCFVMCGGMAAALGLRARAAAAHASGVVLQTLLQQSGRLLGYTTVGALVGGLSQGASAFAPLRRAEMPLRVAAALVTLLVALRVLSGRNWLAGLERLGSRLWRRLQPLAQRATRGGRWYHTLLLGLLWGWLPCGMVYSALLLAATSGSSVVGGGVMLSFGLGTLPALLVSSLLTAQLPKISARPTLRTVSGVLLVILAVWMLLPQFALGAHHVH